MPFHRVVNRGEEAHNLHYKLFGEQDPANSTHRLLFTMGLGGMTYHWEPQIEFFAAQPGFTLCVYDNRGIGFSEPVKGRWTTRAMAGDALSLLNHLGWTEHVHLVGLSMGGMVTQQLALLDLPRFASITLISTAAGGRHSLQKYAVSMPFGVQKMGRSLLSSDREAQLKAGLSVLFPDEFLEQTVYNEDKGTHETNFHRFRRTLIKRGNAARSDGLPPQSKYSPIKQALAATTHHVSRKSLQRMRRHFKDASLVITGDQDILVHHSNSHVLRDGLGGTLVMIENAGHGANEQHPETVNQAIVDNVLRGEQHVTAR